MSFQTHLLHDLRFCALFIWRIIKYLSIFKTDFTVIHLPDIIYVMLYIYLNYKKCLKERILFLWILSICKLWPIIHKRSKTSVIQTCITNHISSKMEKMRVINIFNV